MLPANTFLVYVYVHVQQLEVPKYRVALTFEGYSLQSKKF